MCPVTFPDTNGGSFRSHMWMDRMNGRERLFHRPDLAWTYNKVMVVTKCTLKNIVRGWKKIVGKKWTDQRYEQDRTLDASSLCYHGSQFIYCFSVCSIYYMYLWSGVPHWHVGVAGRSWCGHDSEWRPANGMRESHWMNLPDCAHPQNSSFLGTQYALHVTLETLMSTVSQPSILRCSPAHPPSLIRRRTPWSTTLSFLNTLELKTHSYV